MKCESRIFVWYSSFSRLNLIIQRVRLLSAHALERCVSVVSMLHVWCVSINCVLMEYDEVKQKELGSARLGRSAEVDPHHALAEGIKERGEDGTAC